MTATDELRRMLDERGVEWSGIGDHTVLWCRRDAKYANYDAQASDWGDKLMLSWACTPEQAIEATLGHGTCEIVCWCLGSYRCKTCGARFFLDDDSGEPNFYDECGRATFPNYCPNCGRHVVAGESS